MSPSIVGVLCLLVFAVTQAVRDTFFGSVFQSVSFFLVVILGFGASTVVFGSWVWLRRPVEVRLFVRHGRLFAALNVSTAVAWIAFFFGLKHLEPAIVNMLYTGVGPLAVLALSAAGLRMVKPVTIGMLERAAYAGVFASLVAVAFVALFGHSGLAGGDAGIRILAVGWVLAGGVVITISHMIARQFNDLGIGSDAIMGLRFLLTVAVALVAELAFELPSNDSGSIPLPFIAVAAFGLIVIPSFFLQLGVARASPLAVNAIRSLGPVFVFGAQLFDGRIRFSGATLACILAFVIFATISGALRGWAEAHRG